MTWEYLAGFFDGEGTTGIYKCNENNWQPRFGLCQSRERGRLLLEEIREFFAASGMKTTKLYAKKAVKPEHAVCYMLQTNNRDSVQGILTNLLPFLRIKREEAQFVLAHMAANPKLREGRR